MQTMLRTFVAGLQRLNSAGNHDFCPWANRYFTWLRHPLAWISIGALAALGLGLFGIPQAWIVLGSLVAVLVLGVIWPWLAIWGVRANLTFSKTRCHERDCVIAILEVENRWPFSLWGLLARCSLPKQLGDVKDAFGLTRVPGWSKSHFRFEYTPETRGQYPTQTPVIETGFPFGLWSARKSIAFEQRLIVWPRLIELSLPDFKQNSRNSMAAYQTDEVGDEGAVTSARPYRYGDPLRRVHWAHTVQKNVLMVCERETSGCQQFLLAIDEGAFANAYQTSDALDNALRIYASLAKHFSKQGASVRSLLNGELYAIDSRAKSIERVFDALALFVPDATPSKQLHLQRTDAAIFWLTPIDQNAETGTGNRKAVRDFQGRVTTMIVKDRLSETEVITPHVSKKRNIPAKNRATLKSEKHKSSDFVRNGVRLEKAS